MALLQNITARSVDLLRSGSYHGATERVQWGMWLPKNGARSVSNAGMTELNAIPDGYNPHYSWLPCLKAGALAVSTGMDGTAVLSNGNLAGGKNASATLAGMGIITTPIVLVGKGNVSSSLAGMAILSSAGLSGAVLCVASLSGVGGLTQADLKSIGVLIASLAGQGEIAESTLTGVVPISATITSQGILYNANLAGGKYLQGTLQGNAALTAAMTGKGNIEAVITIGASPSAYDIASAIWGAIASGNNVPGTMGEKVNAAGTAGDPWTAILDAYPDGTAGQLLRDLAEAGPGSSQWDSLLTEHQEPGSFGEFVQRLLTVAKFLGLK